MKKLLLLLPFAASTFVSNAQLHLSGSSPYTQNFDTIGTSLPNGWLCYTGAAATAIVSPQPLGSPFAWSGDPKFGVWADSITGYTGPGSSYYGADIYGKGYKNSASADVSAASDTGGVQRARTNRALAVKQTKVAGYEYSVSPAGGPAFVLHLAYTHGMTNIAVKFQLQSLDYTDANVTTWVVDEAVGASPTVFTPATTVTGDLTTGGLSWKNSTINASFGTAIDNQNQDVWIRIANLSATTGSGTRTTTGIDDFSLTWTGTAGVPSEVSNVSAAPQLAFHVIGFATAEKINFEYNTDVDANYNLAIYDITGRVLHTENISAIAGQQQIAVNGLHLSPGMYFAKMSNSNSSSVARVMIQ